MPATDERSPAPWPKQRRAVRTRAQILDAAAEAFARKGFAPVTIVDIAELAGMTKGAVYFHYANKESLAVAVSQRFYGRLREIADSVRERPPLVALSEFLVRTSVAYRDDRIFQAGARLQLERLRIDIPLQTPYVDTTYYVARWLHEAAISGELGEDADPDALARVLVSAFFGAQHISWVLNDREDILARVQEVVRVVVPATPAL